MSEPHVLMLGWEYPPFVSGGLGVACEGLVEALRKETSLTLVLPRQFDGTAESPSPASPYADGSPELYGPDLVAEVEDYARRAVDKAKRADFDLIHAHDWMTARAGLEIRAQTGKPLVFHVHSLTYDRAGSEERSWIREVEEEVIQQANLVVAVSEYTRQICLDHYGAEPEKTVVVHNGIRPVTPYRLDRPFTHKLVVFVGRLVAQKNPRLFLEIAAKVLAENPNVRFAMAGAGEQLRGLMAHAVRLGIGDKVHFTGFLNRKKIHDLFAMADLLCMPSTSEPFGLSALEAAQFGVPVVISEESGASEILSHARTVTKDDPDGFAHELIELLANESPSLPRPSRSWGAVAEELLAHYRTILT